MKQTELCEITITAPPGNWIIEFCKSLITEKLCACANIDEAIHSVYSWKGEIHEELEARARLHTKISLADTIIERVRSEHPYSEPSLIVTPIIAGSKSYLEWIVNETC